MLYSNVANVMGYRILLRVNDEAFRLGTAHAGSTVGKQLWEKKKKKSTTHLLQQETNFPILCVQKVRVHYAKKLFNVEHTCIFYTHEQINFSFPRFPFIKLCRRRKRRPSNEKYCFEEVMPIKGKREAWNNQKVTLHIKIICINTHKYDATRSSSTHLKEVRLSLPI